MRIKAFSVRVSPVTNAEFQAFVAIHPEWRRDRVAPVFADGRYLLHWHSATGVSDPVDAKNATLHDGAMVADYPVTNVSWFAAQAFCENEGARLPVWYEWEYLAAANASRPDARTDPVWLASILAWYGKPNSKPNSTLNSTLNSTSDPDLGSAANYYGVRAMHGVIWEWVDDFNALFISPDSRNQGDPDKLKFCGAGAISLQDKQNFAILMRLALLSSLSGADTTENLGFRCVRPLPPGMSPPL